MEALTKAQKEKWKCFSKAFPDFTEKNDIIRNTSEIGKIMGIRSSDVVRDLSRISKRLGNKLRIQHMKLDSRNRFFPAESDDLRKIKGGRQRGTSLEKGLKGNSIWLRIWLEK